MRNSSEAPWYKKPDWWIQLGISVAGIGVIAWQAMLTRQSVKLGVVSARAARVSARAAKVSADSLINSERARVMVELKPTLGTWFLHDTDRTDVYVNIVCRNAGPTPAWIYEQALRLRVTEMEIVPHGLYGGPDMGGAKKLYAIHPLALGQEHTTIQGELSCEGYARPGSGLNTYVYGYVKYRDAFKPENVTWFGYVLKRGRLDWIMERIPNEAYNRDT